MTIKEIILTHCQLYEGFQAVRLGNVDAIANEIIGEVEHLSRKSTGDQNGIGITPGDWQRFKKENGVEQ